MPRRVRSHLRRGRSRSRSLPATAAALVTDNFTGANGSIDGRTTTTGGKTWAGAAGFAIATNRLESVASAAGVTVEGGATGYVQALAVSLVDGVFLRAHAVSDATHVLFGRYNAVSATNYIGLQLVDNALVGSIVTGPAFGANKTLKIDVTGGVITYYVDGVSQGTDTLDATMTAETSHGFFNLLGGAGAVFDDFEMSQA